MGMSDMWPFSKTEKRALGDGYTRAVVDRILALHTGDRADVGATAAAAAAAGIVGRSFAAAAVEPSVERTGLDAEVLAQVGASLITAGESVWLIEVDQAGVNLVRASSWDIVGTGHMNWRYRVTIPGPSNTRDYNVPEQQVLHPRVNCSANEPHRGRSPLALAGVSAEALANAERQVSEELSGPVGRLIPAPLDQLEGGDDDDDDDPLTELEKSLANLKGRSALVPSMARDWGGGPPGNAGDWQSRRIGADPPDSVVKLRQDGHFAVLAACGIPPMLFASTGQSQASREALRQFLHLTVAPMGKVVQIEATRKLAVPVALDFAPLHASDVQGRARAFQSLVGGGMEVERAARLSGLLIEDGE